MKPIVGKDHIWL